MWKSFIYMVIVLCMIVAAIVVTKEAMAADNNGKVYTRQTLPGTSITDWRAPAYISQRSSDGTVTTRQTLPGTNITDWRAPAYVTKPANTQRK